MSRRDRPKQLLPLIGGKSLLEIAWSRIAPLVPDSNRLICTAERFRAQVKQVIPRATDAEIIGEPEGRDTLNAIGLTAAILARRDPAATFAVLTADHLISPEGRFRDTIARGFALVEENPQRLVTFSIEPRYPATEYGYVERGEPIASVGGAFKVRRFVEKPDEKTALAYLEGGRHGWNSGMFIFSARGFLRALERFKPEAHSGLLRIADGWGTARQKDVLGSIYPTLPKISVDFAVMEPASTSAEFEVCTVAMDCDWIDVGSWPNFAATLKPDAAGNRGNCRTLHIDSRSVLAVSDDPSHTIVTIGCVDLIIIRTADATLIVPASRAQRVKDVANAAPEELR
jgi:mannose-1-phosphate guanylyltransferase